MSLTLQKNQVKLSPTRAICGLGTPRRAKPVRLPVHAFALVLMGKAKLMDGNELAAQFLGDTRWNGLLHQRPLDLLLQLVPLIASNPVNRTVFAVTAHSTTVEQAGFFEYFFRREVIFVDRCNDFI